MTGDERLRVESMLDDLRRQARSPRRFQRAVRRFARTGLGARLFSVALRPADAAVLRVTSGQAALTTLGAGVPVITLRSTGSRTGRPHTAPLAAIALDGGVVVIGSNFGRPAIPAWARNLSTRAEAEVVHRGWKVAVRARRLRGDEEAAALAAACEVYPPFATYVARAGHRKVPIFLLEPLSAD